MADNHTYEIIIRAEDGVTSAAAPTAPTNATPTASKAPKPPERDFSKYIVTKTLKPYAQQTLNYAVSNVGLTTGSTELQQKVELGQSAANMVIDGYTSIKAGIATAAGFGLSTGAGAAVALAIFAVGKAVDYSFKAARLNLEKAVEAERLAIARTRAGIVWNQRGE